MAKKKTKLRTKMKAKSARTTKKKATKKKRSGAKASSSRQSSARSKSGSTSVDGILKKFKKERSTLESKLSGLRKNIEDLNAKTQKLEVQIEKLVEKEHGTEQVIAELDAKRDTEVSELLSRLGVKLGQPKHEPSSSTLPFSSQKGSPDGGGDSKRNEGRFG